MDESVKRRERLQAMRMEASQGGACSGIENSTLPGLANPLVESSSTPTGRPAGSFSTPRFDYYTDPMSAYSGDTRRSKVSNHIPPEFMTPPRPTYQPHSNYSPNPSMYRAQSPNCSPAHATHQQTPPPMWNDTSSHLFPSNSPRGGNFPGHGFVHGGSPSFHNSGQPNGLQVRNSFGRGIPSPNFSNSGQPRGQCVNISPAPGPGLGRGGSPSPNFPNPGHPRGHGVNSSPGPGPGLGRGFSPSPSFPNQGQPRDHLVRNSPSPGSGYRGSPSPGSGRGGGRWSGSNRSPGLGRGGGRGSNNHVSAELRPDMYYNKSMVEDPWKFLEPIVWRRVNAYSRTSSTPSSQQSWLPESIRGKKARVSDASNASGSRGSLAEFLAASFNEVVNKESVNEEPSL